VIELGRLRISSPDAAPLFREKVRAALISAGVRRVVAGQAVSILSQAVRAATPADIELVLDEAGRAILLRGRCVVPGCSRFSLPDPLTDAGVQRVRGILSFLTRDELLHDLERQVQQRTAELQRERERSERLLQNMLPATIAARMKDDQVIADHHTASVMFVDLVGFTALARNRAASSIVSVLDRIFRVFDAIVKRHGLEKIKTIGDGYLAVAGLPHPQIDHVDRAVLAGLDVVSAIPALRDEIGEAIDVRVGIHTGDVLAGVIGVDKPFYDIWGDTVNVASRLEKNGAPGRVHVSEDVYRSLGDRFGFESRGGVELKNRGRLDTWYVDWKRPSDRR
jgi:class 3 adenylate cyclase